MDFISDGWREEIEEAIVDAQGIMSSGYRAGVIDGLREALKIIENHI